MQEIINNELSKRPIKVFDEEDLANGEKTATVLRTEIQEDHKLADAWGSPDGRIIQQDLLKLQRRLEREAMDIPLTNVNLIAVNRGMWKQLDELIYRHILKKSEAIQKQGRLAALVRKTKELAERLKQKIVKVRG